MIGANGSRLPLSRSWEYSRRASIVLQYFGYMPCLAAAAQDAQSEGTHLKAYYYWIAVLVFAIDQFAKWIVATQMELYQQIPIIGNFFLLTSIRNPGAAFGILKGQSLFFILVTIVVVAGIIWYIERNKRSGSRLMLAALGLVLGGALGNFLDRAAFGEVVDFLQFNFGSYTFPIFNLADTGIVTGVGLILLDTLLDNKRGNAKTAQDGDRLNHDSESNAGTDESAR